MDPVSPASPKTIDDWLRLPEDSRLELIDGLFVEKDATRPIDEPGSFRLDRLAELATDSRHAPGWVVQAQSGVSRDGASTGPTVIGWRSNHLGQTEGDPPSSVRPDWVCEVISCPDRSRAFVRRFRQLHRAGVPHLWVIDARESFLTVYRHTPEGYLVATTAEAGEFARLEPFGALELRVGLLFGEGPDDPPASPTT